MDAADFDSVTIEDLRRTGGLKWSRYPDAIGAFVAEMDFGTAPAITEALHATIERGLLGYLPVALRDELASAHAAWAAARYGWEVKAEDVRLLPDVLAGLRAAIEHLSAPETPVILPTPAYMPFLDIPPALGRRIIEVPMASRYGRPVYDLDALDAAFRAGGELLVLCNPHNPVGRVLERDEMEAVADVVAANGGRVFSDEIHAPLVFPGHHHLPYASLSDVTAGHAVTATSASKAWNLPGLKCAQLILSNDADRAVWAEVGSAVEHGASNPGVVANTVAFGEGGPWLDEVLAYLDGNRRLLAELVEAHLPGVEVTLPEGTYLAWLDCRALDLDDPGAYFLERAGVALTSGTRCGEAGTGHVRCNFATPRPILTRLLEQMGAAIAHR